MFAANKTIVDDSVGQALVAAAHPPCPPGAGRRPPVMMGGFQVAPADLGLDPLVVVPHESYRRVSTER